MAQVNRIESPVAEATVRWLTQDEGGRSSGRPLAKVYMATAVFVEGGEEETQPGWPASADQLSILLEKIDAGDDKMELCLVGFLVPALAREHLQHGAKLLVLEGPRVVAHARIDRVYTPGDD